MPKDGGRIEVHGAHFQLAPCRPFATGLKIAWTKGPAAALEYHQRAIQLDPNFAMGYRQLGAEYDTLGELGRARACLR